MALEAELKTYQARLPELLKDEGKFVLIQGGSVVGAFDTYEDALRVGYAQFGLGEFLVKKIQAIERALYFTREVCLT